MIKYIVQCDNSVIEFASQQEAEEYVLNHSLSCSISIVEEVLNVQKNTSLVESVTNQQLRMALVLVSFEQNNPRLHPDAIKEMIEVMVEPNRSLAMQQWEYANSFMITNPFVKEIATSSGFTEEHLNGLWSLAATL